MVLRLPRSVQMATLDDNELAQLASAGDLFTANAGDLLFRQGMRADALYIVMQGRLEIATRIPGDDAAVVSTIGPGEMVGEFALLDDGPRSASVIAVELSEGLRIERSHILAARAEGLPWARAVMDALRLLVARRTRATLDGIVAAPSRGRANLRTAGAGAPIRQIVDDEYAAHLSKMPRLRDLADRASELVDCGTWLAAGRGSLMTDTGGEPGPLLLVVRGALRTAMRRPGGIEQVAIYGPGELAGLVALLDGKHQPLLIEAAEDALLFAIDQRRFEALRAAHSPLGYALFDAIGRQLVRDQRRVNRHLGSVIARERFNAAGASGDV